MRPSFSSSTVSRLETQTCLGSLNLGGKDNVLDEMMGKGGLGTSWEVGWESPKSIE